MLNKQFKLGTLLASLLVGLFFLAMAAPVSAQAATKNHSFKVARVWLNQKYQKSKLTPKKKQPVRVYTTRYLRSYVTSKKTKAFYSTHAVGVNRTAKVTRKSNGKNYHYRYVKSANGKVKGWVAASALKGKLGKQLKTPDETVTTKAGLKRMINLASAFLKESHHSKQTLENVRVNRKDALKVYHNKKATHQQVNDWYDLLRITMTNLDKHGNWIPVG